MRRVLIGLAAAALLGLAGPSELVAQQKSKQLVTSLTPATEALPAVTADSRSGRMVVGAVIGGLVGGVITVGCLWLHGMGAPAALPYCVIPAIIGVAFGAWVGGNTADDRSIDAP